VVNESRESTQRDIKTFRPFRYLCVNLILPVFNRQGTPSRRKEHGELTLIE
jgi:hypothetical protein